jgi:hypothetical protein
MPPVTPEGVMLPAEVADVGAPDAVGYKLTGVVFGPAVVDGYAEVEFKYWL